MEHTIEIKKIISGGLGLGYLEGGMVVMVPLVLPGERVRIREKKRFSGHVLGELLAVEQPAPGRLDPFCPAYGSCGGCNLQHMEYGMQTTIKRDILVETLERGGIRPESGTAAVLPSPRRKAYRHTARFHLDPQGRPGFHRAASNSIFPLDHCPLLAPELNRLLARIMQSGLPGLPPGSVDQLKISCSPTGSTTTMTLHARPEFRCATRQLLHLRDTLKVEEVAVEQGKKTKFPGQPAALRQDVCACTHSYTLSWDSRCFFQINPEQNLSLVKLVCRQAGDVAGKRVLDLYCGMGNFSIPLALAGATVTGVEINSHGIRAARRNHRRAGLEQGDYQVADVHRFLKQLAREKTPFDLILLDPPRRGVGKPIRRLAESRPEKILYISCDPATLTRDLGLLAETGYHPTSVYPMDMFPHTYHIESLAVLEKN